MPPSLPREHWVPCEAAASLYDFFFFPLTFCLAHMMQKEESPCLLGCSNFNPWAGFSPRIGMAVACPAPHLLRFETAERTVLTGQKANSDRKGQQSP